MNSLNILSHFGTPPPSPSRSRAASVGDVVVLRAPSRPAHGQPADDAGARDPIAAAVLHQTGTMAASPAHSAPDEKTPLLPSAEAAHVSRLSRAWLIPKRISHAVVGSVKAVLAVVASPVHFLIACFADDDGRYSLISPVYKMTRALTSAPRKPKATTTTTMEPSGMGAEELSEKGKRRGWREESSPPPPVPPPWTSAATSDSEQDSERPPTRERDDDDTDTPSRHTRSKSTASSTTEEIAPAKRSIRIKLHNEQALRQRKAKKGASRKPLVDGAQVSPEAAAALKSPTGSSTLSSKQLTKFPRAPQPPRPLVPRRQPSYSTSGASSLGPHQKTLIIDLDETLIHSMAKGGRRGHMIEVKLQHQVGAGGQIIGPQVPIIYYVHKRPHCDEFLKKVCKWYNLIAFTASVQEYADPVIDHLETERKYFAGRYYRQHCTYRNGAYIKDVAQVEPDLSKVMIIDNSPMSYIFNEDNAIPIEGWISDPTDNDLLHLIPLLEGLQYVTDVRALLALRLGQPQTA